MTDAPRKKPGWKARVGLLAFTLLFTALLAEIGLRATGYKPPEVLTAEMRAACRIEPNAKFIYRGYLDGMFSDFATPVQLNSLGFHDLEHAPARSATNGFRLLVVGDSYVAALSCPLETTFFRRLEARLQKDDPMKRGAYEVIALGQGNQAQEKETAYIKNYGPIYQPDAVLLLFFTGNDFMENSPEIFRDAGRFATLYKKTIAPKKIELFNRLFIFRRSRLNGLIAATAVNYYATHLWQFEEDVKKEDLVSPELGVYHTPLTPAWQAAYDRTARLLSEMKTACSAINAPLLIAGLSGPQAIGDIGHNTMRAGGGHGLDPQQPSRWLEAWCRTNNIPFVALEPSLTAAGKRKVFWRHDGHLNPYGNEVVVAPILDLLATTLATNRAAR